MRLFYYTRQTCEMLEQAIRAKLPGIKKLHVYLDPSQHEIVVEFEDDRYTPAHLQDVINSLPKYVK